MAKHKKPTPEELEAGIKAAQDAILKDESSKKDETETVSLETSGDPAPEETKAEAQPDTSEAEATQTEGAAGEREETEEEINYKKKFTESTREGQVLHSKVQRLNSAIEEAISIPEPTDEDMMKQYKEWDMMTELEKQFAKDNFRNRKALEHLTTITKETKDIEAWNAKVDSFADDPKTLNAYPELEGKTDEFKVFASRPTRRGVEFEDLVKAFMYDATATVKKSKGKMFETGTGGPSAKPVVKSDKLSAMEGRTLMKQDYKKWKELLLAGKIANE